MVPAAGDAMEPVGVAGDQRGDAHGPTVPQGPDRHYRLSPPGVPMKRVMLAVLIAVCTFATPAFADPAPPAPAFIETQTDNPVTAEPPVSRPAGPHCTVTLADHFM